MRILLSMALIALVSACSTSSQVQQAHAGLKGRSFDYQFSNRGGDNAEGIAELDRVIRERLRSGGYRQAVAALRLRCAHPSAAAPLPAHRAQHPWRF